jgi:hypothetical protein
MIKVERGADNNRAFKNARQAVRATYTGAPGKGFFVEFAKMHNCRVHYEWHGPFTQLSALEFDKEEDYTMFLLKWA